MLRLYRESKISMLFDDVMSLSIYSDSVRQRDARGIKSKFDNSSNICIRLMIDGNIRFLGKPHAVKSCFRDFHNLIHMSMMTLDKAISIVSSLKVLSSSSA